jgi:hypothetical protein
VLIESVYPHDVIAVTRSRMADIEAHLTELDGGRFDHNGPTAVP